LVDAAKPSLQIFYGALTMSVQEIDHGWRKLRVELLKLTEENAVYIGIQGKDAERSDGGLTNAQIGTFHEFGAPSVGLPQRSFLRGTLDENREKYAHLIKNGLGRVVDGKLTVAQVLGLVGERIVADVRKRIKTGIAPALKAATLRRKTRKDGAVASTPLILTGQLLRAITWVIRPRGEVAQ
jgi:hypothetical protein